MTDVGQLPDGVREFAAYLQGLVARVDQGAGWCGVFWQRDPEGMRACLDGREVPPWDVVRSLHQDLAAAHGQERADHEAEGARTLHRASARAHDAAPGGREALVGRIDVMVREQHHAAERGRELGRRLTAASTQEEADSVRLDLAWARDDHERAGERIAELRERLGDLASAPVETRGAKGRKRRPRGSARFAGMPTEGDDTRPDAPPTPVPAADVATPRGARFAGAALDEPAPRTPDPQDAPAPAEVAETVRALHRLRAADRSGEAHIVLVDAAHGAPARLPLLAAELHRAGLDADWATLLWEAASLPPERLVDAVDALLAAGRDADGRQLLRQGVSRPPGEIGDAVSRLAADGQHRRARTLLDAYVRGRTPEEAARCAHSDPDRLVPLIADAARGAGGRRYRDVTHALRVAGFGG